MPQLAKLPDGVQAASTRCTEDGTFVISTDGRLYACGSNRHNKAALSSSYGVSDSDSKGGMVSAEEAHSFLPAKIPEAQGAIVDVAAGVGHTTVLTVHGAVYTFGSSAHGQLGRQTLPTSPAEKPSIVTALHNNVVQAISCGDHFTIAITKDLCVWGWGKTAEGRLAQAMSASHLPAPVRLSSVEEALVVGGSRNIEVKAMVSRYNVTLLAVQKV